MEFNSKAGFKLCVSLSLSSFPFLLLPSHFVTNAILWPTTTPSPEEFEGATYKAMMMMMMMTKMMIVIMMMIIKMIMMA